MFWKCWIIEGLRVSSVPHLGKENPKGTCRDRAVHTRVPGGQAQEGYGRLWPGKPCGAVPTELAAGVGVEDGASSSTESQGRCTLRGK